MILFAADFSENSKEAFRLACALAVEKETRLVVVHVVEPNWIPDEPVYFGQASIHFHSEARLEAYHKGLKQKLRESYVASQPIDVQYQTVEGDPEVEILRRAREIGSDLIVMGTHGRTGLGRLLAGSVTIAVLRGANCPVVALRPPERPTTHHDIQVIVGATDFSRESEAALQVARSLARDLRARLVILHVAPLEIPTERTPATEIDPRVYEDALAELCKRLDGSDLKYPVETRISRGFAQERIIQTAEELGCDLLVLGTHGRTGLSRALMGSVAETVLLKAGRPVMVVSPPREVAAEIPDRQKSKMVTIF
jgi:nucleotide-binding universal stress UspA family protein